MREELVEGEPVVEGETRDVVDADLLGEHLEDRPRDDGGRLLLKDGLRDVSGRLRREQLLDTIWKLRDALRRLLALALLLLGVVLGVVLGDCRRLVARLALLEPLGVVLGACRRLVARLALLEPLGVLLGVVLGDCRRLVARLAFQQTASLVRHGPDAPEAMWMWNGCGSGTGIAFRTLFRCCSFQARQPSPSVV